MSDDYPRITFRKSKNGQALLMYVEGKRMPVSQISIIQEADAVPKISCEILLLDGVIIEEGE